MDPFFILDTPKSFEEASVALQEAVAEHGFGVLAVHDLGNTLRSKGLPFPEQCRIFEVCNPQQAAAVLSTTMALLLTQAGPSGGGLHHGDHRGRCGLVGSSAKVTHPPLHPGITVSPR